MGQGGGNSGILTLAAATASQSMNNIITGVPYSVQSGAQNSGGGGGGGIIGSSAGSSFAVVTNRGTSLQGVIPVATSINNSNMNNSANTSQAQQQQQQVNIDKFYLATTVIWKLFQSYFDES